MTKNNSIDSNGEPKRETILSEPEAANFIGLSEMTLKRKRKAGELSFYKPGFRVLYSLERHLLPFLAASEKNTSV